MDEISATSPSVQPLSRIQELTGRFLAKNWMTIPHVTHHDDVDITDIETKRAAWNAGSSNQRYTILPPLMKAVASSLRQHPEFNASLSDDGKSILLNEGAHIGIATEVPGGLLVPVFRDVDRRSAADLREELATTTAVARDKGLPMSRMTGGGFTITSLGHIGSTGFTPIINAPEVAILGVSRAQMRATPGDGGTIQWRTYLPLSLSYDHRVINGAQAARFIRTIEAELEQFADFS